MEQEKRCNVCNRKDSQTEIFNAIYEGETLDFCEDCAKINMAIILRKPSEAELSILSKPAYKFAELRQKIKEGKRINDSPRMKLPDYNPSKVRGRVWKTREEKANIRAERIAEKVDKKDSSIVLVDEPVKEEKDKAKIDFKSKFLSLGDLKRIKEKMFGKKQVVEAHQKIKPDSGAIEIEDKSSEGIEIIDIEKD